jgi:hypothetical protein
MVVKIKGNRREGPCGKYWPGSGFYPYYCIIENEFPIMGKLPEDWHV